MGDKTRGNPTVEATCKTNSCDAETATVESYASGGYRWVLCDGCGRRYKVPGHSGHDGGPYTEGQLGPRTFGTDNDEATADGSGEA